MEIEELEVEIREEEPPFLPGQTKRPLDLSPGKLQMLGLPFLKSDAS
jgi:hypothetical protein